MRTRLLLFFALLITSISWAQVHKGFRWIGPDHHLYSVNIETGIFSKESPLKIKTELGLIQNWESIKKDLPGDFDINTFYQKESVLITVPGTGLLFDLKLNTLSLTRLDQTFFRGYNFNAAQFIRNDTLFSVGGEGFWQKHSILTFYNPKTFEWDLYDSKNENRMPSSNRFSGYSQKYDAFFSAHLETDSAIKNKDVFFNTFSFKHKSWETKGKVSKELLDFTKVKYRSAWTGEYLLLFTDKENGNGAIRIIDPFQNELYRFEVQSNHFFLSNCEIFYSKGYLYSRNNTSAGRMDKFFFDSLRIDSMVRHSEKIGKVYETTFNSTPYLIGFIALCILILGGIVVRNRYSTSTKMNLTDQEWLVVNELLQSDDGYKISSTHLNHLLQLNQKSYDNQRQIRNRTIVTINRKLFTHFGAKELILRSSNAEDKRMMDYYINPEIKPKELERLTQRTLQS